MTIDTFGTFTLVYAPRSLRNRSRLSGRTFATRHALRAPNRKRRFRSPREVVHPNGLMAFSSDSLSFLV
jgi:hypothetical protein